jgi:hypothetical protein
MMSLGRGKRITLALNKSISASFSLIASSIIIYKIYLFYREQRSSFTVSGVGRSPRSDRMSTYHRMMLSISLLDVLHSLSSALSTVLVPPSTGAVFAHGTIATCAAQGFFQQLTPTIVIYMALMNTYFMLKIRYNISDHVFQTKYEPIFHAIPIAFFFITGTTGLSLKVFNAILIPELGCWLGSYPIGCIFTNTCTRGYKIAEYLDYYAWGFAYIWLFLSAVVVLVNSLLIYSALRSQEEKNSQYLAAQLQHRSSLNAAAPTSSSSHIIVAALDAEHTPVEEKNAYCDDDETLNMSPESAPTPKLTLDNAAPLGLDNDENPSRRRRRRSNTAVAVPKSQTAAVQSCLYVASAFFTAIWIFLPWLGIRLGVSPEWKFFFGFMVSIVSPSQGVFNLFVFVRLQYQRLRRKESDWSRWKCMVQCLFSVDRHE